MIGASFVTLFYWAVFGAVVVYVLWLINAEIDRRNRIRRLREMRERRDQAKPKPWTYRQ